MEGKTTLGVIGVIALVLWVVTIAALGWFFVNGWTKPGADGRTEIVLAPSERDQILAEMRQLLKAVDGVVRGLGESRPDHKQMEEAARAAGMKMAADTEPTIMAKLPLPFKQDGDVDPQRHGRTRRRYRPERNSATDSPAVVQHDGAVYDLP